MPDLRRMVGRSRDQENRASTPLEALFDLCFVVAVAQAGAQLHHAVTTGHFGTGVIRYAVVFFSIWWAWVNFTWFASAYDTDDLAYRLVTFVQIAGGLVIAAGIPSAFNRLNLAVVTSGYVLMRVGLLIQWLRVSAQDPPSRRLALRYAGGIGVVQVGWVLRLQVPQGPFWYASVALLALADLAVPLWAEHAQPATSWNPVHITERYNLFTLIVLGEAVAAGTIAVQQAGQSRVSGDLILLAFGALLLISSIWWLYFAHPAAAALRKAPQRSFSWGYAHYLVFASVAAVGAGLQVATDVVAFAEHAGRRTADAAIAVAVTGFLLGMAFVRGLLADPGERTKVVKLILGAVAVLGLGALGLPPQFTVPLTGLVMAVLVTSIVISRAKGSVGSSDRQDR